MIPEVGNHVSFEFVEDESGNEVFRKKQGEIQGS